MLLVCCWFGVGFIAVALYKTAISQCSKCWFVVGVFIKILIIVVILLLACCWFGVGFRLSYLIRPPVHHGYKTKLAVGFDSDVTQDLKLLQTVVECPRVHFCLFTAGKSPGDKLSWLQVDNLAVNDCLPGFVTRSQ